MSRLTVIAKIVARQDCVEDVKAELLRMVAPTRQEDGCIRYDLHQDNLDQAVFIFYETWKNADCLEKHIATDHYKAYLAAVADMVKEKAVHKMTRIE